MYSTKMNIKMKVYVNYCFLICKIYILFFFFFSETKVYILSFLKEVRDRFGDKFNAVASSDPEIANFVQTL